MPDRPNGPFSVNHVPAANTQATVSMPAVAGRRYIVKTLAASFFPSGIATAAVAQVSLRDGASGAGVIRWAIKLGIQTAIGQGMGFVLPVWIEGVMGAALTLEFEAAGGANTVQTVAMTGELEIV